MRAAKIPWDMGGAIREVWPQMIKASPSRSNDKSKRYVVSEEEMAQNLFKMECIKNTCSTIKDYYFVPGCFF